MNDTTDLKVCLARVEEHMKSIDKSLKSFVTKDQFAPVKVIAYGLAGTSLIFMLNQILGLISTAKAMF